MSLTHYLNADFDVGLWARPRPGPKATDRQVRELTALGWLGAAESDRVLTRVEIPDEYREYVRSCGFSMPSTIAHPRIDPRAGFRPFGWSAEAIELNRLHDRPAAHPPLPVVRRVNARGFGLEVERRLDPRAPAGRRISDPDAWARWLEEAAPGTEWVVKSAHANSGLGNRRVRVGALTDPQRAFVLRALARDDHVVVEPWLERERDFSVVFPVPASPGTVRIHEVFCTRDGAHIGSRFAPDPDLAPRDEARLLEAAETIGGELARAGYTGPVCVDAFTWLDGGRRRLRRGTDLNARRSMSEGAYRLWRRHLPDRVLYYRFFNRRKVSIPLDPRDARRELGDRAYDPARRTGVFLAGPPAVVDEGRRIRPSKLALAFVERTREGVHRLEREFRQRFEGTPCA